MWLQIRTIIINTVIGIVRTFAQREYTFPLKAYVVQITYTQTHVTLYKYSIHLFVRGEKRVRVCYKKVLFSMKRLHIFQ